MSRKYVLVRIHSDNPCEAFPLGNCHDGPEIFDDLHTAESVELKLKPSNEPGNDLGGYYLPARIIAEPEIGIMERLGYPIAYLPDNTPIAVII